MGALGSSVLGGRSEGKCKEADFAKVGRRPWYRIGLLHNHT